MLRNEELLHKIESLPEESRREVEDFVDFILHKKRKEITETSSVNEPASQYDSLKGSMKGFFKVSDDFNDPLDDFKEYME